MTRNRGKRLKKPTQEEAIAVLASVNKHGQMVMSL